MKNLDKIEITKEEQKFIKLTPINVKHIEESKSLGFVNEYVNDAIPFCDPYECIGF